MFKNLFKAAVTCYKNVPHHTRISTIYCSYSNVRSILKTTTQTKPKQKKPKRPLIFENDPAFDIIQKSLMAEEEEVPKPTEKLSPFEREQLERQRKIAEDRKLSAKLKEFQELFDKREFNKVFEEFEKLKAEQHKPDGLKLTEPIFTQLLAGFGNAKKLNRMNRVFEMMKEEGVKPTIYSFNALIDGYGKGGMLQDMERCFEHMKQRCEPNIVSYNIMINAYKLAGDLEKMQQIYQQILDNPNVKPTSHTFHTMMDAYASVGKIKDVLRLTNEMKAKDIHPDPVTFNIMLKGFLESGEIDNAITMFNKLKVTRKVNQNTFNLMLTWYTKNGKISEALDLYAEMKKSPKQPNEATYYIMLNALGCDGNVLMFGRVLNEMKEANFTFNKKCFEAIIKHLATEAKMKEAEEIFEIMIKEEITPTIDIVNQLIFGYARLGKKAALVIAENLEKYEVVPNPATLNAVVTILKTEGNQNELERVSDIFDKARRRGVLPPVSAMNILIDVVGKKSIPKALELLEHMKKDNIQPDVCTYNTLLSIYGDHKQTKKFEEIFEKMKKDGIEFNEVTYGIIINNYAKHGIWRRAIKYLETMKAQGFKPGFVIYTGLLYQLSKQGLVSQVENIFEQMKKDEVQPTHSTYAMLISNLADNKKSDAAWKLFDEFQQTHNVFNWQTIKGLLKVCNTPEQTIRIAKYFTCSTVIRQADESIVHNILQHCEQHNKMEAAVKVFDHMKQRITPSLHSFKIVMNLLSRAQKWDAILELHEELKRLNIKTDERIEKIEKRAKLGKTIGITARNSI